MPEEKKCPHCSNGHLAELTCYDYKYGGKIFGCDECQYMEDEDHSPVFHSEIKIKSKKK